MAQWFQQPKIVPDGFEAKLGTSFEDDHTGLENRERLLNEAHTVEKVAVHQGTVLIQTRNGRMMFEIKKVQGCEVVNVTWAPNDSTWLWTTWFNKSTLKDLGEKFRRVPENQRADFNELYINPKVTT